MSQSDTKEGMLEITWCQCFRRANVTCCQSFQWIEKRLNYVHLQRTIRKYYRTFGIWECQVVFAVTVGNTDDDSQR